MVDLFYKETSVYSVINDLRSAFMTIIYGISIYRTLTLTIRHRTFTVRLEPLHDMVEMSPVFASLAPNVSVVEIVTLIVFRFRLNLSSPLTDT